MKYAGLEEAAQNGNLLLHKYSVGHFTRAKYIYSKTPDILDSELISVKQVSYTKFYRFARTKDMPEHQSYRITKDDYKNLLEAGATEEITN